MEPSDRLGRGLAVVLGAIGLTCLLYGGYGIAQGTGGLVWFAPRLKEGAPLVAAIALPWMCGGALLWVAGGKALRDAVQRRGPTRRWLGTLATGTVLAATPGLVWWGWLPSAWFAGRQIHFAYAGWLLHAQFASAGLAALLYFMWSRRLQSSPERFGATVVRCAIAIAVCFGAVALWMREPAPDSPVIYDGKSAVEWAALCHSDEPGEDMRAWESLRRMGADAEPGWRRLVEAETELGGRFASVWMSWCFRQKEVVGWYDGLRLDDGLAAPAFFVLQDLRPVKPESLATCRRALQSHRWGLPAQEPARHAAATALARMGPAARPAFVELFDYIFEEDEEGDALRPSVQMGELFGLLGEVGIDSGHPRREEVLRRIAELVETESQRYYAAARVLVQLDPGGPFGGPALSWLADHACTPGAAQALSTDELATLGPLARPVLAQLSEALIENIATLHPAWEFLELQEQVWDGRAVWRALAAIAPPQEMKTLVIAALRHDGQGPQLVAAEALAEGLVDDRELMAELWTLLDSDEPMVRASVAWAIAVQDDVGGERVGDVVLAVAWFKVERMLPKLTKQQRDRVTGLLERGITNPNADVARIAGRHYGEFHERSQELDVDESGADK